jgi:hypothetical protein
MADTRDTYIDRVCDALADVLTRAAAGTTDRMAGYVANFDFWVGEAEHCLLLIKEYDDRFRRFHEAQQRVAGALGRDRTARPSPILRSSVSAVLPHAR